MENAVSLGIGTLLGFVLGLARDIFTESRRRTGIDLLRRRERIEQYLWIGHELEMVAGDSPKTHPEAWAAMMRDRNNFLASTKAAIAAEIDPELKTRVEQYAALIIQLGELDMDLTKQGPVEMAEDYGVRLKMLSGFMEAERRRIVRRMDDIGLPERP